MKYLVEHKHILKIHICSHIKCSDVKVTNCEFILYRKNCSTCYTAQNIHLRHLYLKQPTSEPRLNFDGFLQF